MSTFFVKYCNCKSTVKLHLYKLEGELGLVYMESTSGDTSRIYLILLINSIQKVLCFKCKASYFVLTILSITYLKIPIQPDFTLVILSTVM